MNECPHGLFDVCCTNYDNCAIGEPKKEWVGLTEEETNALIQRWAGELIFEVAQALKEKNGF